jgi:hypothetical protein
LAYGGATSAFATCREDREPGDQSVFVTEAEVTVVHASHPTADGFELPTPIASRWVRTSDPLKATFCRDGDEMGH